MWGIFNTLVYAPLYNLLIFIIDVVPGGSAGLAIILITVIVKIILFPLAKKSIKTQAVMKKIAPRIEELKKEFKDDHQKQVQEMMALYKKHNVSPFAGFATILIQLPVVIGLYLVFFKGGLPTIDQETLYSFIRVPQDVSMHFLGIDLAAKSVFLALLAGASQYVVGSTSFEMPEIKTAPGESFKDDIMRTLYLQTKYMLPVLITVFAYMLSSAIALHWVVGNVFTVVQDRFVKKGLYDTDSGYGEGGKRTKDIT